MSSTIRDVANRAKVSPSTVSAVLNDKGYVHPKTRTRVLNVIRELNYTPRRSARNLTNQRSGNLGFILNERYFNRAEPFYTRVFLGTEFQARNHDLYVLFTSVDESYSSPKQLPRFLQEQNVDGVIIAGEVPDVLIEDILSRDVPLVLIDFGNEDMNVTRVLIDNKQGVRLATRHLIAQGHTAIGFVGGSSYHPSGKERFRGYCQAMGEANIEVNKDWIECSDIPASMELGDFGFENLLKRCQPPSAVVCFNDATAFGVIRAARRHSIKVPTQLSVVGFDDVEASSIMHPPLTTVKVFKEDLGAEAVRSIVDRIQNPEKRPITTRIGVELIVRQSTEEFKPR